MRSALDLQTSNSICLRFKQVRALRTDQPSQHQSHAYPRVGSIPLDAPRNPVLRSQLVEVARWKWPK